jgi:DNA-binding CsgD family transcriptional regulator
MLSMRTQQVRAFRSVKRICYAGLDSIALRAEVGRTISNVVPADAWTMATVDPDTALFTHSVSVGVPSKLAGAWLGHLYPVDGAESIIELSRSPTPVSTEASGLTTDLIRSSGFEHEMRTVLTTGGALWGFCCLLRGRGTASFRERDKAFMRRIAPHVAAGLRTAALLDQAAGQRNASGSPPGGAGSGEPERWAPGVMVLDVTGRIRLRNAPASAYLADLADVGMAEGAVPSAVAGAVARLMRRHAPTAAPGEALSAELRARGRSGRWYVLEASLGEPDGGGDSSLIVLLKPAQRAEVASILTRLYGLTRRERETVARVARGESTKQIARALGLSPYTVQEYTGKACEKVGVRSRKALLAKLFFDGYAPGLATDAHVELDSMS